MRRSGRPAQRRSGSPAHRRCLGCGRVRPKPELLRLAAVEGRVVPDPGARLPGRGAYVCRNRDCAGRGLLAAPARRAFRAPVEIPDETLNFLG